MKKKKENHTHGHITQRKFISLETTYQPLVYWSSLVLSSSSLVVLSYSLLLLRSQCTSSFSEIPHFVNDRITTSRGTAAHVESTQLHTRSGGPFHPPSRRKLLAFCHQPLIVFTSEQVLKRLVDTDVEAAAALSDHRGSQACPCALFATPLSPWLSGVFERSPTPEGWGCGL